MKSKKMAKSTFAIIIMGIVMVAMLAFGGTFAYFTSTAGTKTATATTGTVKLTATGTVKEITGFLMPQDVLCDAVTVTTAGSTVDTYVIVEFSLSAGTTSLTVELKSTADGKWVKYGETDYYIWSDATTSTPKAVAKDTTLSVVDQVKFDSNSDWNTSVEDSTKPVDMGAEVSLKLGSKSVQVKNVEADAKTILTAAGYTVA